jgi:hypothetical protein
MNPVHINLLQKCYFKNRKKNWDENQWTFFSPSIHFKCEKASLISRLDEQLQLQTSFLMLLQVIKKKKIGLTRDVNNKMVGSHVGSHVLMYAIYPVISSIVRIIYCIIHQRSLTHLPLPWRYKVDYLSKHILIERKFQFFASIPFHNCQSL